MAEVVRNQTIGVNLAVRATRPLHEPTPEPAWWNLADDRNWEKTHFFRSTAVALGALAAGVFVVGAIWRVKGRVPANVAPSASVGEPLDIKLPTLAEVEQYLDHNSELWLAKVSRGIRHLHGSLEDHASTLRSLLNRCDDIQGAGPRVVEKLRIIFTRGNYELVDGYGTSFLRRLNGLNLHATLSRAQTPADEILGIVQRAIAAQQRSDAVGLLNSGGSLGGFREAMLSFGHPRQIIEQLLARELGSLFVIA